MARPYSGKIPPEQSGRSRFSCWRERYDAYAASRAAWSDINQLEVKIVNCRDEKEKAQLQKERFAAQTVSDACEQKLAEYDAKLKAAHLPTREPSRG